jgi:hypothetical protein
MTLSPDIIKTAEGALALWGDRAIEVLEVWANPVSGSPNPKHRLEYQAAADYLKAQKQEVS